MCTFSTVKIQKLKIIKCALSKKYVNQLFPDNSKTKRDIAKISAVLKPMKSNYYVLKFWKKSEQVYFFGRERVLKGCGFGSGKILFLFSQILLQKAFCSVCKILT